MHDAWRTAPDRAPGFSGSLIQGNRVFETGPGPIRLSIVWRASFYADSGVRVSTPPFEPIGDVTREAERPTRARAHNARMHPRALPLSCRVAPTPIPFRFRLCALVPAAGVPVRCEDASTVFFDARIEVLKTALKTLAHGRCVGRARARGCADDEHEQLAGARACSRGLRATRRAASL